MKLKIGLLVAVSAMIASAIDAAFLAGMRTVIVKLLQAAVGRLTVGGAAAAVTSQADGPLPGPADLVALGIGAVSVGWTVWEVNKARKVIPNELSRVMYKTVDAQRAEVERRTLDEGKKLYMRYAQIPNCR